MPQTSRNSLANSITTTGVALALAAHVAPAFAQGVGTDAAKSDAGQGAPRVLSRLTAQLSDDEGTDRIGQGQTQGACGDRPDLVTNQTRRNDCVPT